MTLDAIPGTTFDGKVYAIDPAHDPNGRAVILRARIAEHATGQLRSGMFARVALARSTERKDAIMVPEDGARARWARSSSSFASSTARPMLTKVKVGQRVAAQVEIVEGLAAKLDRRHRRGL